MSLPGNGGMITQLFPCSIFVQVARPQPSIEKGKGDGKKYLTNGVSRSGVVHNPTHRNPTGLVKAAMEAGNLQTFGSTVRIVIIF